MGKCRIGGKMNIQSLDDFNYKPDISGIGAIQVLIEKEEKEEDFQKNPIGFVWEEE